MNVIHVEKTDKFVNFLFHRATLLSHSKAFLLPVMFVFLFTHHTDTEMQILLIILILNAIPWIEKSATVAQILQFFHLSFSDGIILSVVVM